MIFVAGCVSKPVHVVSRDCLWAERINWTAEEGDAIVDCCPAVAEQLISHNDNHERECL